MPFDGISFSDPGYRATSPSEMNIHAEMSSKAQAKTYIKKLNESHKVNADGKNNKNSKDKNLEKEEHNEEDSSEENAPDFLNKSKKIKKFKVSFNRLSDMVELVDRETGKIIETISPNDLLALVSKSKTASGILVDRTI